MDYIFTIVFLFIVEVLYLKIADRFNIIDKPNERSSHSTITIRGGGIVFYVSSVIYFMYSGFQYPWFFLGLSLLTYISFLDDIRGVHPTTRLIIHLTAVLLMAYEFGIFELPWYYLVLTFVFSVGVINAYNFMDGINGMTAFCTLVIAGLLAYVNTKINYIEQDFLIYTMLGVVVFGFFNFRKKAVCFAGDVGPAVLSFMLLFALGKLILKTGDFSYILFLGVYGIEIGWSVMRRIYQGYNIFEPHRTFLFQLLTNELGRNSLIVSTVYGIIQLILGVLAIYFVQFDAQVQWGFATFSLSLLSVVYLTLKQYIFNHYNTQEDQVRIIHLQVVEALQAPVQEPKTVEIVSEVKVIEMVKKEKNKDLMGSGV